MAIVSLIIQGKQGSGKTRLIKKISKFLADEGFSIIIFSDLHKIEINDPLETLNQKEKS